MASGEAAHGSTEPRIFSRPLRKLTPKTSLGFEVIDFARDVLGVILFPWQCWLLIHALELLPDGRYRFRRVIVLVARQNGKTTLMGVLAAWWLAVDSRRHPDKVPAFKFKVVGIAQNLDIAREPWEQVKLWCNPNPANDADAALAIPALRKHALKVVDAHGQEAIYEDNRAHYEIRADARGKPATRVILDEIREQHDWKVWNAVSQTTKSFWSGQMWAISNAGDSRSVVLKKEREIGIKQVQLQSKKKQFDTSLGLFEWSALDGCALDDVDAILQANPSIGYGGITVADCISDSQSMQEAGYRTEVLCQWVTAKVDSYINPAAWRACEVSPFAVDIPHGQRTVWGVDVSHDRSVSCVAAATTDASGHTFVEVRERRPGMLWVPDFLSELAEASGSREVALQSKGCASMEFIGPLTERGLDVMGVDGSHIGIATGRFRDRVRDRSLIHVAQPAVDEAISAGVVKTVAENVAWDRRRSIADISGLVAETVALYELETHVDETPSSAYEDGHGLLMA